MAILDRPFFFDFDGNPYTDITPAIANGYWPRLTSLKLRDITVDDLTMIVFLRRHPRLRRLSASLSLIEEEGPPLVPFSFESYETSIRGILPNLEYVDLPPAVLRPFLRTVHRPTNLQSIQHLDSGDWSTDDDSPTDSGFLTTLDDVWGLPSGEDVGEGNNQEEGSSGPQEELLAGMPKLRILSLASISTLKQLEKLHRLTPGLEHLTIVEPAVRVSYPFSSIFIIEIEFLMFFFSVRCQDAETRGNHTLYITVDTSCFVPGTLPLASRR